MSPQMKSENPSLLLRLRRDESGAVIVLVAIMIIALIGLSAMAVDVGNLAFAQRRLQSVTDMAALAGAEVINCSSSNSSCTTNSAVTAATTYSGVAGNKNAQSGLSITMASGYPQLKCLTSTDTPCTAATAPNPNANAIMVQEQAHVPFLLGQVFGFGTVTLTATSLASKGGSLPPMNIMIVLDNTASMNDQDGTGANCGNISNPTRIECALAGIQTLLAELWPSQDNVGLIVFPPVSSSSAANDTNCSSTVKITPEPYSSYTGPSGSSVYQIVGLTSNYKASNSSGSLTSPNSTSSLVNATCQSGATIDSNGVTGNCGSCQGNKVKGGEGTYLAGAITAAQATLAANSASGVQNVIIVLSDGGAGNASNLASMTASQNTLIGGTTLYLTSAVPAAVIPGSSVADTTSPDTGVIASGTQVVSVSGSTVVISNAVSAVATIKTTASTTTGGTTLQFASSSFSSSVAAGTLLTDSTNAVIPSGAKVTNVTTGGGSHSTCPSSTTCVTISTAVTGTINSGDSIVFGGVASGDTITFGSNNQCNEAITAAQDAANAGTWVYAIAYGSYTQAAPNSNSCSDVETYPIANVSSCQTMENIANSPGVIPDLGKFYSDPMNVSPACTSPDHPNQTDITTIFETLGLQYTALLPNNTN
jgi:Flp pilus assembly protein TadG